mgnify:CR=1 FL=1
MYLLGEKVFQQKCSFVLLVLLNLGMSTLTVPRVRSKVNRDVRVMSPAPGKVIGDTVMCSRMKQHVDLALPQMVQIAGYKDFISNVCCEFLKVWPRVPGCQDGPIESGAKVAAREHAAAARLG